MFNFILLLIALNEISPIYSFSSGAPYCTCILFHLSTEFVDPSLVMSAPKDTTGGFSLNVFRKGKSKIVRLTLKRTGNYKGFLVHAVKGNMSIPVFYIFNFG